MEQKRIKSFAANIIIIFSAQIIVKVLGMLYRLVITNVPGFGDAGNGFYSAGFQIYTLLLAVSSVGIPNAIAKLVSEREAVADHEGARSIFQTSLLIFAVTGALLSVGLFIFANPIAKYILHMEGARYTMAALAPSIFFVCIAGVFRGYFSGINRMNVLSVSQVLEQIFKSVLTIVFVLLAVGQAPEIMSGWANFATTLAAVSGALYLLWMYKRNQRLLGDRSKCNLRSSFLPTVKTILLIAVPVSLCAVISAVNRIVDTATITRGIEQAFSLCIPAHGQSGAIFNPTAGQLNGEAVRLAGMLAKSDTLINLPLAMNIAFATVLVPAIAKCKAVGNAAKIKEYIDSSLLTSVALVLPCAAGYMVLAQPIYHLIYPNAPLGYELLQLSAVSLIFTALNQTVTAALQGLGKIYLPAVALAAGCIIKVILNCVLISVPQINIYGAVIGSIACQLAVFIIEFCCLCRTAPDGVAIKKMFAKPVICNVLMGMATYYIYKIVYGLSLSNAIALLIAIAESAILYGIFIIIFKVFAPEQLAKIPVLKRFGSRGCAK